MGVIVNSPDIDSDDDIASWAGVTRAAGFDAFAATPSSANLRALVTDESGSGALLFANGAIGTPSSGVLTNATGLPISTGVADLGTGVATALAVNVGSAGAPVVNGGAGGTPSSLTLTNATGLPVATGISGLGSGWATHLGKAVPEFWAQDYGVIADSTAQGSTSGDTNNDAAVATWLAAAAAAGGVAKSRGGWIGVSQTVSVPDGVADVVAQFRLLDNSNCVVVETENASRRLNFKTIAAATSGDSFILVNDPTLVSVDEPIQLYLDNGAVQLAYCGAINAGTGRIDLEDNVGASETLNANMARGMRVESINPAGVAGMRFSQLRIEGGLDYQKVPDNICLAQTRTGAGNLVMNGGYVDGDGVVRTNWGIRLPVFVYSTGDNTGITITITGDVLKEDFTYLTGVTDTITGPGADLLAIGRVPFSRVTNVATSDTVTGNLRVAIHDGDESMDCMRFWGQMIRLNDVNVQRCRGWGYRSSWITPSNGWAPNDLLGLTLQTDAIEAYYCEAGLWLNDGPIDAQIRGGVVGGFMAGDGIYFAPRSAGSKVSQDHTNGGNTGSQLLEPNNSLRIEAFNITLEQAMAEGGRDNQILVLQDSFKMGVGCRAFYVNDETKQTVGVTLGEKFGSDVTWTPTAYDIRGQIEKCHGVNFVSDGGHGIIELIGYGRPTTATGTSGNNTITVADTAYFPAGTAIDMRLDTGALQSVTINSYAGSVATISANLTGNITAGKIYRDRGYTGTPNTTENVGSKIYIRLLETPAEYWLNTEQSDKTFGASVNIVADLTVGAGATVGGGPVVVNPTASGPAVLMRAGSVSGQTIVRWQNNAGNANYATTFADVNGFYIFGGSTQAVAVDGSGNAYITTSLFTGNSSFMARSTATLANGAGAGAGTLANAPSVGNPTKWIPIDDNGTTRYIPSWTV